MNHYLQVMEICKLKIITKCKKLEFMIHRLKGNFVVFSVILQSEVKF